MAQQPAVPSLSRRAFIGDARFLFQYKPGWPNSGMAQQPAVPSLSRRAFIGRHGPYSNTNRDGPTARRPIAIAKGFYWGNTAPIPIQAPGASRGTAGHPPSNPSIPNRDGPIARIPIAIAKGLYWGNTAPIPIQTPAASRGAIRSTTSLMPSMPDSMAGKPPHSSTGCERLPAGGTVVANAVVGNP